jgi:hypothetical protein
MWCRVGLLEISRIFTNKAQIIGLRNTDFYRRVRSTRAGLYFTLLLLFFAIAIFVHIGIISSKYPAPNKDRKYPFWRFLDIG